MAFSAARTYHKLATNIESVGFEIRDQIMWLYATGFPKAQQIQGFPGWKTQLKPAHEPICMARRPVKGAQYKNMERWGVGALNIAATRIPRETDKARFPTNVIGEVAGYHKFFYCPKITKRERNRGCADIESKPLFTARHKDAKALGSWADKRDQAHKNNHPTVKPVELMKYLAKLVAPQGAHIIDPFAGSGSTGMACKELGMRFTGIELDKGYCEIAERRIAATQEDKAETLFE